MIDESYVGKDMAEYTFEVERSKIRELNLAIGDNNPIFFDKEKAKAEGYEDTPAPLTFATVMTFWGYPEIWDKMTIMGINKEKLLHGKEEYEYAAPIYPGDVITAKLSVEKVRNGGALSLATFKTEFSKNDETALVARMTIAVPGEEDE